MAYNLFDNLEGIALEKSLSRAIFASKLANIDYDYVFHKARPKEMLSSQVHSLEAWPKGEGNSEIAQTHPRDRKVYQPGDPKPAGYLDWHRKNGQIDYIEVNPEHQRQGLATQLYNRAIQISQEQGLKPPKHSPDRTNAGDAWAKSTGDRLPKRIN